MKRFIAACALSAAFAYPAAAEQCEPLKIVASLDMTFEHGHVLIPVTVDNQKTYFMLGTANPYSAISAAYADAHNFTRVHSDVSFFGIDGKESHIAAIVPSFGIDQLKSEHTTFIVAGMADTGTPDAAQMAHGILGADFLRAYDVELDFAHAKLNLISRDHCDAMPVYWPSQTMAKLPMIVSNDNKIIFDMTLDGHEMKTILNTGLQGSSLKASVAKEIFGIDDTTPGNRPAWKLPDGTQLYTHRFQSLSVPGLTISNPVLLLLPSLADQEIEHRRNLYRSPAHAPIYMDQQPDVTLGLYELRNLHIYIDYHHQMVYLTPAAAPATAGTH